RDRPDWSGTSRLSPHLHFGEISPRQVWHAVRAAAERRGWSRARWRQSAFLTELGWREFAHHLLHHFPHTTDAPLREEFARFPWRRDAALLRAWQRGRTGYPIVDAGLRELWATGWMHNRVRMIVASFLVKDLLLPWQEGARWFWDTLVDADLANNTLGWQWSAGCGADAAPFFRIFNPVLQGRKFDPNGDYVRRWCPELAALPDTWIHEPDRAPADVLQRAGVELGKTYPTPVVNHTIAREVALEAFAGLRRVPSPRSTRPVTQRAKGS
ncbi:MAG: FAD-binding domain-containing protein, partial [Verrucomicrobiales bacterium]|nr:FAD-binding domain-containing protein [Verrucomicrobiales bacterium]